MDEQATETWRRALLRFRRAKDDFMRSDADSPLGREGRQSFAGLNYFEPNPLFRFEATLERYASLESVIMTTSKGTRQLFNKVGSFELPLEGGPARIQAYQSAEKEDASIFIPFRDATSGAESYGAARYLDLDVEHNDRYAVDFNYAYNPYCAYSEDYVCPLPPAENWLRSAVRAGERKYRD